MPILRTLRTAILAFGLAGCHAHIVQQADLAFEPPIPNPGYAEGTGPVVQIDEAHFNFHTAEGRYAPFAKLLRRDGYVVRGLAEPATASSLSQGQIFVVANALAENDSWKLPTRSAFRASEVSAIREWVESGGSLLLIADHMPMPGAVEELAAAFDILFHNGFLFDAAGKGLLDFTREAGLANHPITEGRNPRERVESVRTFTGQAFRANRAVDPLLTVPSGSRIKLPLEAWEFEPETPSIPADGMLQGAAFRFGEGRVVVFGEAAMFSAQEVIRKDVRVVAGMNHPDAAGNAQLLLNVMHWLSGLLE